MSYGTADPEINAIIKDGEEDDLLASEGLLGVTFQASNGLNDDDSMAGLQSEEVISGVVEVKARGVSSSEWYWMCSVVIVLNIFIGSAAAGVVYYRYLLSLLCYFSFIIYRNCPLYSNVDEIGSHAAYILKSEADHRRTYEPYTLANKLPVLLISDAKADKAAAALSVGSGSFMEGPKTRGLAHFCEHMLFLGSTKYPSEGEYHEYVAAHGGSSNAYTSNEETNFYFHVNAK
jgi:hypothetical protein